jgi:hypothetical protein
MGHDRLGIKIGASIQFILHKSGAAELAAWHHFKDKDIAVWTALAIHSRVLTVPILSQIRRLLTYLRAPQLRKYRIQRLRWYWRLRKRVENFQFRINRRVFGSKHGVLDVMQKGAIFSGILLNIIPKLTVAVLSVVILVLIEHFFPNLSTLFGWQLDRNAEYGFFGTLAQVSATMMGLYFAAVSLVASTAYARVPGDVRAMIVEEQVGNFYFGFLAQFTATAMMMLAAASLGVPLGALNILWISFIGLFGVFSFVVLGLRTFSFFAPAALVQHLNHRLARTMAEVIPTGYKWLDSSFQHHHQRQANKVVETYANLVTISEQDENLNSHALVELAEGLFAALNHYAKIKGRVPTKSFWFRRRPQHKQWLLASHTEVEMARATDTTLQPEMVPDLHWFETEVIQVIVRIVKRLSARADLAGLVTVLTVSQEYARRASVLSGGDEALRLQQSLRREIEEAFVETEFDDASDNTIVQSMNRLAAVDLNALGLINILLGTSHAFEMTSSVALEREIGRIEWGKPASIYTGELPREALDQCEDLRERLAFEQKAEGRVITPKWLQVEVAAFGYARFVAGIVERILAEFETCFGTEVERRIKAGNLIGATSLINRGLEATNKMSAHLIRIRELWNALLVLNRSKEWEWPTIDWDNTTKRSVALRDQLVKNLTGCFGPLVDLPAQKHVPDLFGHAYSVLSDACFDALVRGDEAMFANIFPTYFPMSIEAHQKIRSTLVKVTSWNVSTTLGPLSDLLAISGFAELYSELDTKNFGATSRKVWDAYFLSQKDDAARKYVINMLSLIKEPRHGMSSRDMLRFRWKRDTEDHFEKKGIVVDEYGFGQRDTANHPSALVRVFAARGDVLNDAEDIFLAVYLFRRPEAADIKIPDQVESYQRALEQEKSNKEENNEPS